MILKISFASHAHQHAIHARVIKIHALNVCMSRIESWRDNLVVVCPLTMNLEVQLVISAANCVKNAK